MRLLLLLVTVLVGACASDDPAPLVYVVSATPDELTPADDLADDLRILVEYDDADGDLGGGIAQIHDCRGDQLRTELAIPAIAPDDVVADGARITGSLDLHITDVGAGVSGTPPASCEDLGITALAAGETVFCVVLVDAAGHAGEGDCTPPITLAP